MKYPNRYSIATRQSQSNLPVVIFVFVIALVTVAVMNREKIAKFGARSFAQAKLDTALLLLDKDAIAFEMQTALISKAPECFPIEINRHDLIGVQYLFCSEAAKMEDGKGTPVTDNFTVPNSLARRYNFWRRIYSTWGKDQYVMHLADWPEAVIVAFDIGSAPESMGPVARERIIKKLAKGQRLLYSTLFRKMHEKRDRPSSFSPAMRRLAKLLEHVPDDNKYLKASRTIRLQRGQRDFVAQGLSVATRYFPAIEQEFASQKIPVEISRLAFVESSFNLKALSKVGASGIYQIMPETGRQYLHISDYIDERNDPIKASRAAARILKFYFEMTGSWPLAITAYNHGVGGIKNAVASTRSNDITVLINKYHGNSFGFASKNFYSSFLGMLATLKDKDRLFPDVAKTSPISFNGYRLTKPTSSRDLCQQYGITYGELADYNPDLVRSYIYKNAILPKGYAVKIPDRTSPVSLTSERF